MSKYQNKIIDSLKNGAKLQSTEGANYRVWLIHTNGKKETVRRDSANKICTEFADKLIFGNSSGIVWR